MSKIKNVAVGICVGVAALAESAMAAQENAPVLMVKEGREMKLEQQWDKTFPRSSKVDHKKVTFRNRYGITLAADMYIPRNAGGHCRERSLWRGQGAGLGAVCPDHGRTRFSYHRV